MNLGNVILAGDVVPLEGMRPSVQTLPTPAEKYLPLNLNRMFGPNYDYEWHRILTPQPANDASIASAILRG